MESDALPVAVPIGCAVLSAVVFVLHRRVSTGRVSERYKEYLFRRSLVDGGRGAGLGANYIAVALAFWAVGMFSSYAPLGAASGAVVLGLFMAGGALVAPIVYWQFVGYPERMKPDWYKDREARHEARNRVLADVAAAELDAEVDAMILAGAGGWAPLGTTLSRDGASRPPADFEDSGNACLELDGYRLIPLVLEIEGSPESGFLWAWGGRTPSVVNDFLAFLWPGDTVARVVLDDRELADGEPLPKRYVRIEARGPWRIALRTVDDLPVFETVASGRGCDVVHYVGPPGIAVIRQGGASVLSLKLRDSTLARRPGPKQILSNAPDVKGTVALPSGSVLEIGSEGGPWHIQVHPLEPSSSEAATGRTALEGPGADEIRTFDTAISGDRPEVLLYTGAPGRLRIEYDGDRPFAVDRLSPALTVAAELLSTDGDYEGEIDLRRNALIQIRGGDGPWTLQRIAEDDPNL